MTVNIAMNKPPYLWKKYLKIRRFIFCYVCKTMRTGISVHTDTFFCTIAEICLFADRKKRQYG